MQRGLGTQLRHLLDLLDGAVGAVYRAEGLTYRPRYTPVMRALQREEGLTIGQIAASAGISQPAATQTVALMVKDGLISSKAGPQDGRQRLVRMTASGRALLPRLEACWQATSHAAASLDAGLPMPLTQILEAALQSLEREPFERRIQAARAALHHDTPPHRGKKRP